MEANIISPAVAGRTQSSSSEWGERFACWRAPRALLRLRIDRLPGSAATSGIKTRLLVESNRSIVRLKYGLNHAGFARWAVLNTSEV